VGTSLNIDAFPLIPYEYFTDKHIAFDLIYNPAATQQKQRERAQIKNGYEMLVFQAESVEDLE
jgi:shikimate dehydrogenase